VSPALSDAGGALIASDVTVAGVDGAVGGLLPHETSKVLATHETSSAAGRVM
jgi:hypothetical protein